jgi:hypothetical protein
MRKFPIVIVGGIALSLAAVTATFAESPSAQRAEAPAVTASTETPATMDREADLGREVVVTQPDATVDLRNAETAAAMAKSELASFSSGSLTGTAALSRTTTYSMVHVLIKASGIKNDATLTARLYKQASGGSRVLITSTTFEALTSGGKETITWILGSSARSALRTAIKAGDTISFRLVDGSVHATGAFKS